MNYRAYITYMTSRSALWAYLIALIVMGANQLLSAFVLEGYGIETNYFWLILLIVPFTIPYAIGAAVTAFISSLIATLVIWLESKITSNEKYIYQTSTLYIIILSIPIGYATWLSLSLFLPPFNQSRGFTFLLTILTAIITMSVHYFAFPHLMEQPRKQKTKAEN